MASTPNISVCLPTYNRGPMLAAAIESVLPQLSDNDELLILDNHSTDNTEVVLRQFTHPRIRVVRNDTTVGMYENHNRCIEHARGDWMVVLHSDDALTPDALAIFRRYIAMYPNAACFHPASDHIHGPHMNGRPLILSGVPGAATCLRWHDAQPTGKMYRMDWLKKIPFPLCGGTSDLLLLAQLMGAGGTMVVIPEKTVDIGRGKFQGTHKWLLTGDVIRDFARAYREMLRIPGILIEAGRTIGEWNDRAIAHCLLYMAHADERAAIDYLEKCLAGRDSYQSQRAYKHVRIYQRLGIRGLRLAFSTFKLVARVTRH